MTTEEMAAAMGYADPRLTQLPEDIMQPSQPEIVTEAPPVESAPQGESPYSGIQEEDLLAAFVPGYEPAAPPSPASPPAAGNSRSASVGVKDRGFDEGTHKKVVKAGSRVDQRVANKKAEIAAGYTPFMNEFDQANTNHAEAIRQSVDAENDEIMNNAEWNSAIAAEDKRNALKEEEIGAASAARVAGRRAQFEAKMAEFSAAKVNPNQLYQSMSKGDQVGTLISVFVHDFLGAKGIKTSAMATLTKAVDRNIDAQIQNIKNMGEAAQGFKELWHMERAEATSDAEARARVRTLMLQSMKSEAMASAAQFKTGVTAAKGLVMMAELDKEITKSKFEVYKQQQSSEQAMTGQEYQRHANEVQASLRAREIKLAEAQAARQQRKEEADLNRAMAQGGLPDLDTGVMNRRIRDDLTPEEKRKTRELAIATLSLNKNTKEYIELLRGLEAKGQGNRGWSEIGRLTGYTQAQIDALHTRIISDQLRIDSGLAVTEPEFQRKLKELIQNKPGTVASAAAIAEGYRARSLQKYNDTLAINTEDVKQGDPLYGKRWGSNVSGERSMMEAEDAWKQGGEIKETPTGHAAGGVVRPDAFKKADGSTVDNAVSLGAEPNTDWERYTGSKMSDKDNAPAYAVNMSIIRTRAEMRGPDGNPTAEAKKAREYLEDVAKGSFHQPVDAAGKAIDPNGPEGQNLRRYATFHLRELNEEMNGKPTTTWDTGTHTGPQSKPAPSLTTEDAAVQAGVY